METIGLRELTHRTAAIAQRVRKGETLLVTDHGRPVIRLSPATPSDTSLSDLAAAGLLIPAQSRGHLAEPVETGGWTGEDSAEIISAERDDRA
jgi:prevent-host-death family protein